MICLAIKLPAVYLSNVNDALLHVISDLYKNM